MSAPILSPSDLTTRSPGASDVVVGGRVLQIEARHCRLGDALAEVLVSFTRDPAARPRDWIVVRGRLESGDPRRLSHAELVARHPVRRPSPEFERLVSGTGARLEARSRALRALRAYFEAEGFVEVQTPTCVAAAGTDPFIEPVPCDDGYLITSPEFHMKRLVAGGLPRIYQIAPCFRAEEHGPWHDRQFSMLEWYRAFAEPEALMEDTERLVLAVARELSPSLRLKRPSAPPLDLTPPFPRLSVEQAFRDHAGVRDAARLASEDEAAYFQLYVDKVEPALSRLAQPVFLCEFPSSQAALARRNRDQPTLADRFELILAGVELCNGFGELTDPDEQRQRFAADCRKRRQRDQPALPIDEDFLRALDGGLPPCSGNALGIDRLVALCSAVCSIAEVQAFPGSARQTP